MVGSTDSTSTHPIVSSSGTARSAPKTTAQTKSAVGGLDTDELILAFSEFVRKKKGLSGQQTNGNKRKRKRDEDSDSQDGDEDEDEDEDSDLAATEGRSLGGRLMSRVARRFMATKRRRRRNIPFPNYLGDHINDILGDLISPRVFLTALEPAHHSMYEYTVYVPHPGVLSSGILGRLRSIPGVIWIQIQESKPGEMSVTLTICPDPTQGAKCRKNRLSRLALDRDQRGKRQMGGKGTGKFAVLYNVLKELFDLEDHEVAADRVEANAERMSESTLCTVWPLKRGVAVSEDQVKKISEEPWVTDTCITSFAKTAGEQGLALRLFMQAD